MPLVEQIVMLDPEKAAPLAKVTVNVSLDNNGAAGVMVIPSPLVAILPVVPIVKVLATPNASRATVIGADPLLTPLTDIVPAIAEPASKTTDTITKIETLKNLLIFSPPFFEK